MAILSYALVGSAQDCLVLSPYAQLDGLSVATLFNQITPLDGDESGYGSMFRRNTARKH
jgi:hypothetical protein